MKRVLALSIGLLAAATSFAQESGEYVATVSTASCEVVSVSSSTAGTLAGGAVGSVVGAVGADLFFGRKSSGLGSLIGGLAGGFVGEEIGKTRTYKCIIKARAYSIDKPIYVETVGKQYLPGEPIVAVKLDGGAWTIKP